MLFGYETWSHALREENRILRQIFVSKRDKNGEWRRFNEELHSLYRLPNIVKVVNSRRLR
jgi:hypothetical protein